MARSKETHSWGGDEAKRIISCHSVTRDSREAGKAFKTSEWGGVYNLEQSLWSGAKESEGGFWRHRRNMFLGWCRSRWEWLPQSAQGRVLACKYHWIIKYQEELLWDGRKQRSCPDLRKINLTAMVYLKGHDDSALSRLGVGEQANKGRTF